MIVVGQLRDCMQLLLRAVVEVASCLHLQGEWGRKAFPMRGSKGLKATHLVIIVVVSFRLVFRLHIKRLRNEVGEGGPRVHSHVQLAKLVQVLDPDDLILFLQGKVKGRVGVAAERAGGMQTSAPLRSC